MLPIKFDNKNSSANQNFKSFDYRCFKDSPIKLAKQREYFYCEISAWWSFILKVGASSNEQ